MLVSSDTPVLAATRHTLPGISTHRALLVDLTVGISALLPIDPCGRRFRFQRATAARLQRASHILAIGCWWGAAAGAPPDDIIRLGHARDGLLSQHRTTFPRPIPPPPPPATIPPICPTPPTSPTQRGRTSSPPFFYFIFILFFFPSIFFLFFFFHSSFSFLYQPTPVWPRHRQEAPPQKIGTPRGLKVCFITPL